MVIPIGEITEFCRLLVTPDQSYGRSPERAYGLQQAWLSAKFSRHAYVRTQGKWHAKGVKITAYNAILAPVIPEMMLCIMEWKNVCPKELRLVREGITERN